MWTIPPKTLLKTSDYHNEHEEVEDAGNQAAAIEARCDELGIPLNIEKITVGPQVVSFYCIPADKIHVRKLPSLAPEIQYAIGSSSVSISAPQPGTKFVVIQIAREQRKEILLGDVI